MSGCDGSVPSDCVAQPGDYSQPAGRAIAGVPRRPCLPTHPQPLRPVCVSSDDDNEAQAAADEEMEDDE
jgi:hypothetical protein